MPEIAVPEIAVLVAFSPVLCPDIASSLGRSRRVDRCKHADIPLLSATSLAVPTARNASTFSCIVERDAIRVAQKQAWARHD